MLSTLRKITQRSLLSCGLLLLGAFPALADGVGNTPQATILSTLANLNAGTLTIQGLNFGTALPAVTLDGLPVQVASFTGTTIVVFLPSTITPGSYALKVT